MNTTIDASWELLSDVVCTFFQLSEGAQVVGSKVSVKFTKVSYTSPHIFIPDILHSF